MLIKEIIYKLLLIIFVDRFVDWKANISEWWRGVTPHDPLRFVLACDESTRFIIKKFLIRFKIIISYYYYWLCAYIWINNVIFESKNYLFLRIFHRGRICENVNYQTLSSSGVIQCNLYVRIMSVNILNYHLKRRDFAYWKRI